MLGLVGSDRELRVAAAVHAALVDVGRALDHVLHPGIMPLTQRGQYEQDYQALYTPCLVLLAYEEIQCS